MKYLLKHKGLIAALVFFTMIVVGGVGLVASGNWENPFAVLTQSTSGGDMSERGAPPESTTTTESTTGASERAAMSEGSSGGIAISWSQLGNVLYNVWFLFAAAAVVMVISLPFSAIRKALRQRRRRTITS